jgi:hypothetical protein
MFGGRFVSVTAECHLGVTFLSLSLKQQFFVSHIGFYWPCVTMDRLCGLGVRVPGYTTEMYCASCEVRTEFIYVM